jgi:alpha-galactosidase
LLPVEFVELGIIRAMRSTPLALIFASSLICLAACGGSSEPAGEQDDDFPLAAAPGLSPRPPMGWNSWNKFNCNINANFVRQITDAMVASGMKDAGYQYVNIDDCWSLAERAPDGSLQNDPVRFPEGIAPIAEYVHSKGLKLGIYGDRGWETCGHRAGSENHEMQDAATFAMWGVDYLKYDNCAAMPDLIETQYRAMRSALVATGRDFVYSICAWSFYEWAVDIGHLQRTTTDITNAWTASGVGSILGSLKTNSLVAAYNGPNHWNDPDMLEVGNSDNGGGPVTDVENQSHFSLWAIMSSPLIAGNNLSNMSENTRTILTNQEIIALNQDALGLQGVRIGEGEQTVWAKPLNESGARAVVLLNEGAAEMPITVSFAQIGLGPTSAKVRDLQAHADLGTFRDSFTTTVPSHGTATLKIVGSEPPAPRGTAYLSELTPIYATNGLGPFERDRSNGATDPGDGQPIRIRGTEFARGLGVAAPSSLIYRLGGKCTSFSAQVGVDDSSASGTVRFQVLVDDQTFVDKVVFDSMNVTATSPAASVQVDVTGKRRIKLLVTNAGDGSALDRASWGEAKVECEA